MPGSNEAVFLYDETGLKKMFANVQEKVAGIGKGVENMTNSIAGGIKKAVGHFARLGVAFLGIRSLVRQIPEIGMAFDAAKNVFMRNFLWPLRQAVLPYLQKLLDWVRDNRAQFVKWGQVLANVFRAAMEILKALWNLIGGIFKSITGVISKTVAAGQSAQDVLNLIIFKLTSLFMYVSNILGQIWKGIEPYLTPIVEGVWSIVKAIGEMIKQLVVGEGSWEDFGAVIGRVVAWITNAVGLVIEVIADLLDNIHYGLDQANAWLKGDEKARVKAAQTLERLNLKHHQAERERETELQVLQGVMTEKERQQILASEKGADAAKAPYMGGVSFDPGKPLMMGVQDAVITPKGDVIKTDPKDYLIATKTPGSQVIIQAPVTVYVTEGNAKTAGEQFAQGLADRLRLNLVHDMERSGF